MFTVVELRYSATVRVTSVVFISGGCYEIAFTQVMHRIPSAIMQCYCLIM